MTDSRQSARSGAQVIDTFSRRDVLSVGQRVPLGPRIYFDTRFRSLHEISGTKAGGVRTETERTTLQPSFLVSYAQNNFRAGATGNWLDRRVTSDNGSIPDQTRYQLGASMSADPTRSTDVSALWNHSVTEQEGTSPSGGVESREESALFSVGQGLPGSWNLDYRFSGRSSNLVDRETRQLLQNHLVELAGSPTVGDRLRTTLRARSQFFHQKVETGAAGVNRVLLVPFSAGLTLDDTPEVLDPLEDDPVPTPGLFDGNLDEGTPVDIGDLAAVVREYGGDYRNIQFDLGESQELAGAVLYVDRRLLLPQLFEWHVFVSEDPDGREWTELSGADATITYQEFGAVRQGWEVSLPSPVVARYFKMVDVKLGATVPELLLTEMEVFREETTDVAETIDDSQNHRVDASLGYDLTSHLRFGVQSSVRRRTFEDRAQDLDEVNHTLQSQWHQGRFLLSGRYGIHRLWSDLRDDTDVADYGVTARQGFGSDLTTTLAWTRTEDRSAERDRTTEGLSLHGAWTPTRRLRISQRLARNERTDDAIGEASTSMIANTSFHGSPFLDLTLDLERTDRWVDREAGSGFERFNDTSLSASWAPVPLINLNSYVAYQEREKEEWILRNSATWTPFPGGRTELRFTGSTFSDTRTDNTRYSALAAARWRVHPRVTVDGSVETSRVELADETTTPVSTTVHLLWSF